MVNITSIAGFDARFNELTSRWEHHQSLRRHGASIAELSQSRQALDEARSRIRV